MQPVPGVRSGAGASVGLDAASLGGFDVAVGADLVVVLDGFPGGQFHVAVGAHGVRGLDARAVGGLDVSTFDDSGEQYGNV